MYLPTPRLQRGIQGQCCSCWESLRNELLLPIATLKNQNFRTACYAKNAPATAHRNIKQIAIGRVWKNPHDDRAHRRIIYNSAQAEMVIDHECCGVTAHV